MCGRMSDSAGFPDDLDVKGEQEVKFGSSRKDEVAFDQEMANGRAGLQGRLCFHGVHCFSPCRRQHRLLVKGMATVTQLAEGRTWPLTLISGSQSRPFHSMPDREASWDGWGWGER